MKTVCVIGAGNMGTALGVQLLKNGHRVNFFTIETDVVEQINSCSENKKYLPSVVLHGEFKAYNDYKVSLKNANFVLLTIPSNIIEIVINQMIPCLTSEMIIINIAKGLNQKTLKPVSELIIDLLPARLKKRVVSFSGPSIAVEIANNVPTAVEIASKNERLLKPVQKLFCNENFKVFISKDKIGVDVGGFLKNIIAILAGVCDGLGYGVNLKSALITLGFGEITQIAQIMGAKKETLTGLSGLGDLIVTCFSEHSRNRRFGEKLAQGISSEDAKKEIGQIVEGILAVKVAMNIIRKKNLKLVVIPEVYKIIYKNKDCREAVKSILSA